jgi:hypothetical protein
MVQQRELPARRLSAHDPHVSHLAPQMNESMMLNQQTSSLMRAIDAFNEAIMLVDTGASSWTIMFINDAWLRMMGASCTPKSSFCGSA